MKENQSEATLNILVSEAISTAEIEGERLDRNSVRNSLKRHLGLPHNQRERDQKSEGMASMLLATRTDPNKELDDKTLFGWHRDMLGDGRSLLHKDLLVGEWRNEPMQIVSGHIGYENIDYEAPPPDLVPTLMNEFCDWFNSTDTEVNSNSIYSEYNVGPVRSALAHLWFEVVHPFDDGNGRVGRGIADLALVQDSEKPALFSLSNVIASHRDDYYEELGKASKQLDVTDWVTWYCERAIDAQVEAKNVVHAVLDKTRFWDKVEKMPEGSLNERQEKLITTLFKYEPAGFTDGISSKKYMSLSKTSKATATRDLVDLVKKDCLIPMGQGGRSTRYQLNLEKYRDKAVKLDDVGGTNISPTSELKL